MHLNQNRPGNRLKIIFYISALLTTTGTWAEPSEMSTNLWTSVKMIHPIAQNPDWQYYADFQLRFIDNAYKYHQANLYLGLQYQLRPDMNAALGVFRRNELNSDGTTQNENRLWQQLSWNFYTTPANIFTSRTRLEERQRVSQSQIAYRLRERLQLKHAIHNWDKYFFIVSDEIFLQFNRPDWITNKVLPANRAAIGLEFPLNSSASYEIGYLNQMEFDDPKKISHVVYFNLNL
jgi:hypothetical protein